MSVRLIGEVWTVAVPHHEQSILLALADHADDQGQNIYPSIGYLAWKTGYSERQVLRIMKALRDSGILCVVQPGSASNHRPTHYRLDLTKAPRKHPFRQQPTDKLSPDPAKLPTNCHQPTDTGDRRAPDAGVTRATDTGDRRLLTPASPEPSGESSKKPSDEIVKETGGGATRQPAARVEVDDGFIEELVSEFKEKLGGEERVRLACSKAQNAGGYAKAKDRRHYVRHWLTQDALDAAKPANRQPTAPPGHHKNGTFDFLSKPAEPAAVGAKS